MATKVGSQATFIKLMTPYAQQAASQTGLAANLILAQWGIETGWGTSYAWQHYNNVAGIGITSTAAKGTTYANLQAGVQGYVNFINDNSRYTTVKKAGTAQAQAQALGASGYAAGKSTDGGGPGSSLIATMDSISGSMPAGSTKTGGGGGITPGLATVQKYLSGLTATQASSVKSYLESLSGSSATTAAQEANAAAEKSSQQAQTADSALATLKTVLRTSGLTGLASWATNLTTQLAAQGLSASAISQEVTLQLYTQPTFKKAFPGMTIRKQNGYNAMSIAEYLTYETKAKQMARAAGIPSTFMGPTEIGKLVGNNVSTTELSDRITNAYQVAATAPPETKALLHQYYGVNTGTLAAYFLTPEKAEPTLVNQVTSAQIGTEGVSSGFGALSKTEAQYLQQMGVSQSTARTTFKSLSKLTPLMTALPGTGTEKTSISQSDLVNYGFFGTNQNELESVEQARKAPFEGGGGFVQSAKGVEGAGYGSAEGQQGT